MSCYEGFRLNDAASECSMRSKARIDSLFEDSRSMCSSTYGDYYGNIYDYHENSGVKDQNKANSAVQARIEAMFASIEAESESGNKGEGTAAILPVNYLGAAPVGGRVASVRGLQEPLRQLLERIGIENPIPAELEVSRCGLTFRTNNLIEKTNPFRRIAVWSALKLHSKLVNNQIYHHAFIPLVGDDQTHENDEKHANLYRTMKGLSKDANCYPPIFAVVMRRPGAARILECHAFACKTDEDAVAAAATLYKALLADLDSNNRHPRQNNGLGCVSLTSVASSAVDYGSVIDENVISSKILAPPPVRPPRIKKHSTSGSTTDYSTKSIRKKKLSETNININNSNDGRKKKNQSIDDNTLISSNSNSISSSNSNSNNNNYGEIVSRKLDNKEKLFDRNYSFIDKNVTNEEQVKMTPENRNCKSAFTSSNNPENTLYYKDDNSNSCKNSIYEKTQITPIKNKIKSNKNKLYEQHFKDADKIYTLEQHEISTVVIPTSNENIYLAKNQMINKINVPERNINHRISRIDEYSKSRKIDLLNSENNQSVPFNKCVHKMVKRNRAGSEPPLSRTETAEKIYTQTKLKRSLSDLEMERGDLFTRVQLPRRSSFLKSKSKRLPNKINGDNGSGSGGGGSGGSVGTPLGFTELFDEFKNQEGLTSVDDILDVIIDPEGMSFNELKPLYKEFLLKLASTLTQDELYQRSANIMKRRKRPQRRRSAGKSCLLGRAIKRSVSKLKSGPTEFTSVVFPAKKFNESLDSSSSGETRNRNRNRVLASRVSRRKSWKRTKGLSASEDSDTCKRLSRNGGGGGANRSSSGYVSCSECSFDSESCTCVSADKCYCSLPRKSFNNNNRPTINNNPVICGCDTDSCSESNKCYCIRQPTILEQLKQRGIVPSEGTLSRTSSPEKIKSVNVGRSHSSSRSLEYHKIRPSPVKNSTNKLALDYDLFNPNSKSHYSSKGKKVLVVSARDPHGRLVYVGGTERNRKTFSNESNRNGAHHEALSIKKSAEIAAVFGPESLRSCRRTNSASSMKSSISLEAGLGYLP